MNNKCTIIIPYLDEYKSLISILKSLPSWSMLPNQVIIIQTGKDDLILKNDLIELISKLDISLEIAKCLNAYPGKARNIGLEKNNNEIVAFLDTQTKPNSTWLERGIQLLENSESHIIWGSTLFDAHSFFQKAVRASTYGAKPLQTIPGTIIQSSIITKIGYFIESVRAGEDVDWMRRAESHNILCRNNPSELNYSGLQDVNLIFLIKKWYRNYLASGGLPYIRAHKDIYFYFISFFMIVLAFNWNWLSYDSNIDGWNLSTIVYIPNITKIIIALIGLVYFVFRIVYLPIRKGIKVMYLLNPLNLIFVTWISVILDITKLFAFVHARYKTLIK